MAVLQTVVKSLLDWNFLRQCNVAQNHYSATTAASILINYVV
jgi:hypothetical protein